MLAETPVTQRSPCYSAVTGVLNIHHFATPTTSFSGSRLFTKPLRLRLCCSAFAAESSRELMSSEENRSALRKLNNKQRQVMMPSSSSSNCHLNSLLSPSLFSLSLSSLCSLSQCSLFSLSSFPLASPPSLRSILCPPKIKTSSFIHLVYLAKRH